METGEDEEDIFIPADAVNTALHQDRVQVLLKKEQKPGKRREGTVIKICLLYTSGKSSGNDKNLKSPIPEISL